MTELKFSADLNLQLSDQRVIENYFEQTHPLRIAALPEFNGHPHNPHFPDQETRGTYGFCLCCRRIAVFNWNNKILVEQSCLCEALANSWVYFQPVYPKTPFMNDREPRRNNDPHWAT